MVEEYSFHYSSSSDESEDEADSINQSIKLNFRRHKDSISVNSAVSTINQILKWKKFGLKNREKTISNCSDDSLAEIKEVLDELDPTFSTSSSSDEDEYSNDIKFSIPDLLKEVPIKKCLKTVRFKYPECEIINESNISKKLDSLNKKLKEKKFKKKVVGVMKRESKPDLKIETVPRHDLLLDEDEQDLLGRVVKSVVTLENSQFLRLKWKWQQIRLKLALFLMICFGLILFIFPKFRKYYFITPKKNIN